MLLDYLKLYKSAVENNDKKQQLEIEKTCSKLGMDRITLNILIREENINLEK